VPGALGASLFLTNPAAVAVAVRDRLDDRGTRSAAASACAAGRKYPSPLEG